ncbi:MAG: hypothetical protein KC478_07425 [Bacteriovoracaceae bacterium]|nr:hypothetical protein [Bacteriovoracaceae bacterium]
MRILALSILVLFSSCAVQTSRKSAQISDSNSRYFYKDRTGEFIIKRSVKNSGSKLVLKHEIYSPNELNKALEKTITVSGLGAIKTKKGTMPSMRPSVSQHSIWFEGEKFFSQLKLNTKKRSLDVVMKSPESQWNGKKSYSFPKGTIFCFFTQIPECVRYHGLLEEKSRPHQIQVIWDSFPYHTEVYEKVSSDPFEQGVWAFDKVDDNKLRYGLVIGGQLIIYEFNTQERFENMYWVVQGISLQRSEE